MRRLYIPEVSMQTVRTLNTVANVSIPQMIGISLRNDDILTGSIGFLSIVGVVGRIFMHIVGIIIFDLP